MQNAPIPENEKERLATLHAMKILDTPPEERFDRITRIATRIFDTPISTITLVDSNREWFKSVCGLDEKEGDRAISFCGHAMLSDDIFIILDTLEDERFKDNPMVVGPPHIRFYAGVPIFGPNEMHIGTFCIKDRKPRVEMSESEKQTLKDLASWAELELNAEELSKALKSIRRLKSEIQGLQKELEA